MVSYKEVKEKISIKQAVQILHDQFILQPAKKESSLVSRLKALFS
jgi:hypothetical protein